jgi:hypothetical protein
MTEREIEENGQEYDLKKSCRKVGQLYPVLKAADGEVLDGLHRVESDSGWKTLVLENIKTPEEKIIARLIANFHRRSVSSQEKSQWINGLAEIYRNQGLKMKGKKASMEDHTGANEIVDKICEVTGLAKQTVHQYLSESYKNPSYRRTEPSQHHPEKPAEEVIYNMLKGGDDHCTWARQVITRFKADIETELLESPLFRKKVLDSIPRSLQQPMKPAIAFDPMKDEQVQELMRLKEEDVFRANGFVKAMTGQKVPQESYRERKARISKEKEGYEPVGQLYPVFVEECPQCLCNKCEHADSCIERVRPED